MKEKMKTLLRKAEVKAAGVASVAAIAMTSLASAAEGDVTSATVTTAFQTGFQQMASDALGMIAVIVPIALSVAGVVFLSRRAIGWFKSLAK